MSTAIAASGLTGLVLLGSVLPTVSSISSQMFTFTASCWICLSDRGFSSSSSGENHRVISRLSLDKGPLPHGKALFHLLSNTNERKDFLGWECFPRRVPRHLRLPMRGTFVPGDSLPMPFMAIKELCSSTLSFLKRSIYSYAVSLSIGPQNQSSTGVPIRDPWTCKHTRTSHLARRYHL